MSTEPRNQDPTRPRIYIDKEGNWYQDGIPVLHRRTYLVNNANLGRDSQGRYYVDEGRGKVYAIVEDTPFVVKMIREEAAGLMIVLNDETIETLDVGKIEFSRENVPYIEVKGGRFEARFSRPAYYELARYIVGEHETYYIVYKGAKHPVKRRA